MIWTVLKWVFFLFILVLIIFWIWSGGFAAAARTARTLINPVDMLGTGTTTGSLIRLPWQPAEMVRGPDISGYADEADSYQTKMNDEQSAGTQTKSFGNPSPYAGQITISDNAATESDPSREYIRIDMEQGGSAVAISGWSLQSAVSGLRAYLPTGTASFTQGAVNTTQPITLRPGESALITTGVSPVGVSFRENECTGYLAENQQFHPDLTHSCPNPTDTAASAPSTVRSETGCMDFIQNLPACHAARSAPSSLSSTCRTYLASTFTYGGCTQLYRNQPSFALPSWRVFLAMRAELWYNTHDTIRLLDDQGRIVDVLTY